MINKEKNKMTKSMLDKIKEMNIPVGTPIHNNIGTQKICF